MLTQPTLDTLARLKLTGMAAALSEQMTQSAYQELSFEERFAFIVEREAAQRESRRLTRLLQCAQLKEQACVEDIDFRARRALDKNQMAHLACCDWIRAHQNLIITGLTGCGKTWLACALAHQACRQGMPALYVRAPRLFEELRLCHADGSLRKRLASIAKTSLLLIDDFAIAPIGQRERNDLLELLDDRVGTSSTLVTSQLPVEHWHDYIGEPTLADAILDRLLHNSHKIQLKGESLRKRNATAHDAAAEKRKKID